MAINEGIPTNYFRFTTNANVQGNLAPENLANASGMSVWWEHEQTLNGWWAIGTSGPTNTRVVSGGIWGSVQQLHSSGTFSSYAFTPHTFNYAVNTSAGGLGTSGNFWTSTPGYVRNQNPNGPVTTCFTTFTPFAIPIGGNFDAVQLQVYALIKILE